MIVVSRAPGRVKAEPFAAEEIAFPEPTKSVLRERRVIWHTFQAEPAEPAVSQIEVNLIAQTSLRSDAEATADQEHPYHQLGIDRRPADRTVEGRQVPPNLFKIDKSIDRAKQVVGELVEQSSFDLPMSIMIFSPAD